MSAIDRLLDLLIDRRSLRSVEDGVYSVFADPTEAHQYDRNAALYDFLVASRIYNRIIWGASPESYRSFALGAAQSHSHGPMLDAGCGSLLFTADAYLNSDRLVICCDQSIDMLRRARTRLRKLGVSEQVLLLQADLGDPLFRPGSFSTVLCMNLLHHCPDASRLLRELKAFLTDEGGLYITSLVQNDRPIGDRYLNLLYQKSWIVYPRKYGELKKLIEASQNTNPESWIEGNMAYAILGSTISTP